MNTLLSSNKAFFILFTLCVVLRGLFEINNPKIISDHSIQIEAAKNYLETGTFSSSRVNAEDLSKVNYTPLKLWPLGLPFFVLFFNFFTGDLIYANICFQVLGSLLFITGMVKLLRTLNVSLLIINLFLLLYAFNLSPFSYLGSTDLFTAALFLWIAHYSIKESISLKINLRNTGMIVILTFMASILRFACIPNIVIIPFFFFLAGILLKQKLQFARAGLILLCSTLIVLLFYKLFPIDSARTGFLDTLKKGTFYFNHLTWFDAFPIKGLLFTRPVEFHLPHKPLILLCYRLGLHLLSFGFLFFLLLNFVPSLKLKRWIKQLRYSCTAHDLFLVLVIVTICVVAGFITLQSLTTPPENDSFGPSWMPHVWTFVYATRYFVYPMTLIIALFFLAWHKSMVERTGRTKIFRVGYIVFMGWAALYWLFTNYQFYSPRGNGASSAWVNEKNSIATYRLINELKKNNPELAIVFAHHKDKIVEGTVINYAKANSTDDYIKIIENDFENSKPLTLILTMPRLLSVEENNFLNAHNHDVLAKFEKEQIVKVNL